MQTMMSMWMSFSTTQLRSDVAPDTSYTMLPKMMPCSVEDTLTFALMLQKSRDATVRGVGFSVSFRSPSVASSIVRFCSVSAVWFTTSTAARHAWQHNVVLVDVHVRLGVDGVREAGELVHAVELGDGLVLLLVRAARRLGQIQLNVVASIVLLRRTAVQLSALIKTTVPPQRAERDEIVGLHLHRLDLVRHLGALLLRIGRFQHLDELLVAGGGERSHHLGRAVRQNLDADLQS